MNRIECKSIPARQPRLTVNKTADAILSVIPETSTNNRLLFQSLDKYVSIRSHLRICPPVDCACVAVHRVVQRVDYQWRQSRDLKYPRARAQQIGYPHSRLDRAPFAIQWPRHNRDGWQIRVDPYAKRVHA